MLSVNSLFGSKSDKSEQFLGLYLQSDVITGYIFEKNDSDRDIECVIRRTTKYSNGWDDIVEDIDNLIGTLSADSDFDFDQTIFFVPTYATYRDNLKQEYKDVMKLVSKELELKPLGYLTIRESIETYLNARKSNLLHAVLIEIDQKKVLLQSYKGGNVSFTGEVNRSTSLIEDLHSIFSNKPQHLLIATSVYVYGQGDIDSYVIQLQNHDWKQNIFIQQPRFTTVPEDELHLALSFTFSQQMILDSDENEVTEEMDLTNNDSKDEQNLNDESSDVYSDEADTAVKTEKEEDKSLLQQPDKFQEDDIEDEADRMGFVIGGEIENHANEIMSPTQSSAQLSIPKISLPSFNLSSFKGSAKVWIGIVVTFIFLGLGLFSVEYFFHRAKVVVTLPSELIDEEIEVIGSANGTSDTFLVQKQTENRSVEEVVDTSGEKTIGERANGVVTIHNFDDSILELASGDSLTYENRKYILQEDVRVASASERIDGDVVKEPGKSNARVEASDIGSAYNVDENERFSIDGLSSSTYFGLSSGGISGGSERKVRVVADADISFLKSQISKKVQKEAEDESGQVLSAATDVTVTDPNYSHQLGEETDKVSVNAEVTVNRYLFESEQLHGFIKNDLQMNAKEGMVINEDTFSTEIENVDVESDDRVVFTTKVNGTFVKNINDYQIAEQIKGLSSSDAQKKLQEDIDAKNIVIETNQTPIFFLKTFLPFFKDNIEVEIKP